MNSSTTTAGMNHVGRLYHYQSFRRDWLKQQLESNSIYCSNTQGFNDPWDCHPCFDLTQLDDPAFYERQVQWFQRVGKRNAHLSPQNLEECVRRLRCDRTFLEHRIRQMAGVEADIQKRYRVYCLTTKRANTLMWSHYAEKHRGICLEYRCDDVVFSNNALKVVYCETYPLLDLADNDHQTILLPLLAKAKDWSYEDEYRLIAQEESEALNHDSLITKNNRLQLPDGALTSIIVGCLLPQSDREAIFEIVESSGRRIELQEARRVPNHFSLAVGSLTFGSLTL